MPAPFRLLLRCYPRAFRERFEQDLLAFLGEEWRRSHAAGGALWRTRFWLRAGVDALAAGTRLRLGGRPVGRHLMRSWTMELGLAFRSFVRAPGFHLLAALTVALGVAAATAVFGVLDGVVLRPLPYPESTRLVRVAADLRMDPGKPGPMSHAAVAALAERSRTLEAVSALEVRSRVLQEAEGPRMASVAAAGPGLFGMLGARAAAGRLFVDADHEAGAARVAVLSWETWAGRYGGDPAIVGRTLRIDAEAVEVVGVLARSYVPPEAAGTAGAEYWVNLAVDPAADGSFGVFSIGRLRPNVTVGEAETEASGILQERYAQTRMSEFVHGAVVIGLLEATVGSVGDALWLVLAGVGLLLAIACANVANLMLARGTDRRGEVVLRVVLGASRGRILVQFLAQSLVIAIAGAVAGTLLAAGALALFRAHGPEGLPRLAEISLDLRAVGFAVALAATASLLFGMLPALQAVRHAPADVLRDGGRTTTSGRGARGALIVAETAMAVVLVLVAGLLFNGFLRLRAVDPGYVADGLVALEVEVRRDADAARLYHEQLLAGVRSVPGVRSAALSAFVPHRGFAMVQRYTVEAETGPEEGFFPSVIVSDGWLTTTGARLVAGRALTPADREGADPVVLVSETLARQYWPGSTDVVGRRIKSGTLDTDDGPWYTVVGVVGDIRNRSGDDPGSLIYHPHVQQAWRRLAVLVRVDGNPAAVVPLLRQSVATLDPDVPIRTLLTARALEGESLAQPRFYTTLVGGFGALALLLALVGIYGTTAYATSRRTREIGVRLALGGAPADVAGLLVREGVRLSVLGTAFGLVIALAGGRVLQSHLFGVRATDPTTFAVTAVAVLLTAALAAWIPARRAARLDPCTALRTDAAGGAP